MAAIHNSLAVTGPAFPLVISANTTDVNLWNLAQNSGWNTFQQLIVTINAGVYIGSSSTGTYALTVFGNFPSGVSIINNGYILGAGGDGGTGNAGVGAAGGPAILAFTQSLGTLFITNNGVIGGGGGGGGGGGTGDRLSGSGSGGGGGAGYVVGAGGVCAYAGSFNLANGSAGTFTAGGAGGPPGTNGTYGADGYGGSGGTGGGLGAAGSTGGAGIVSGGAGGAGGACVSGNSYITWLVTGTRYGTIS